MPHVIVNRDNLAEADQATGGRHTWLEYDFVKTDTRYKMALFRCHHMDI